MSRWSKDAKTHVEYACLDDNKIYLAKHITAIFGTNVPNIVQQLLQANVTTNDLLMYIPCTHFIIDLPFLTVTSVASEAKTLRRSEDICLLCITKPI